MLRMMDECTQKQSERYRNAHPDHEDERSGEDIGAVQFHDVPRSSGSPAAISRSSGGNHSFTFRYMLRARIGWHPHD